MEASSEVVAIYVPVDCAATLSYRGGVVDEKYHSPWIRDVVLSGAYSKKKQGESERMNRDCPEWVCANVEDATQPLPAGVRDSPRETPVNRAVPLAFCVIPVKDINSEREVCGSNVPYWTSEPRYDIVYGMFDIGSLKDDSWTLELDTPIGLFR